MPVSRYLGAIALCIGCRAPDARVQGAGFFEIAESGVQVYNAVSGRQDLQPADSGCCVVNLAGVGTDRGLTLRSSAPLWRDTFDVVAPGRLEPAGKVAWLRLERAGEVFESDSGRVWSATGFDVKMIGVAVRMVTRSSRDTLHLNASLSLGPK